jgi:DNA polymerase-4
VNVGIWNNKFLAKMASDFEKPDKVHTLYKNEIEKKMWPLPIWDLFGCWRATEPELRKMGINTIWELAKRDRQTLAVRLGNYWKVLWDLANWIDNTKVEDNYDNRKWMWASSITRVDTHDP